MKYNKVYFYISVLLFAVVYSAECGGKITSKLPDIEVLANHVNNSEATGRFATFVIEQVLSLNNKSLIRTTV